MFYKKNLSSFLTFLICPLTFAQSQNDLIKGYWAIQPLVNGIANVVSLDGKETTTNYAFECDFQNKTSKPTGAAEVSKYKIENNNLYLIYPNEEGNQTLHIKSLEKDKMTLEQSLFETHVLTFEYQRFDVVKNLCPIK